MENSKLKIVILGSTGMIGHKIYEVLSKNTQFEIKNISRSRLNSDTEIVDFLDLIKVEESLGNYNPDIVINAAGVLIEQSQKSPLEAVRLNALLPLSLDSFSAKYQFKLIQISTDCVFSGKSGPYQEQELQDATSIYGRTKALGENISSNNLVLRTSVIGPDRRCDGRELFNWFMHQSGAIQGYAKSIWSGVTTLELARCVEVCIQQGTVGLHHIASRVPISKFNLLQILNKHRALKLEIEKIDGPINNKTLITGDENFYPINKDYENLVNEMVNDIRNSKLYNHYKLCDN